MPRWILAAALLASLPVSGQTVEPRYRTDEWQGRRTAIELQLVSGPAREETAVVLFVDETDVTALFARIGPVLRYQPAGPPLPAGEHQLIVYTVDASGQSLEIARFPLKVLRAGGFEKSTLRPSLDVLNKGQVEEGHHPATQAPPRERFQDVTLQGGLTAEQQRRDFTLRSAVNVTGVSYEKERLRFSEKGSDAPFADLANYRIDLQKGGVQLSFGNVSFGSQRHLINSFGSRGAVLTFPLGRALSVQFGAVNGSSIVGWNNPLGLDHEHHRIFGLTLGLEARPSTPGTLRFEVTALDGSLQPINNFNQGAIRSAELSRGGALRLLSSMQQGRLTIDGGIARSRFEQQSDAELEGALPVVPLQEKSRDASYLEVSLGLLQNRPVTRSQNMNARVSYQFERVDPLYRSVAAYTQADVVRQSATLAGNIGPLMLQVGMSRIHDNLAGIASVLRTKTKQRSATLGLALATLFPSKRAFLLPTLSANYGWTHQFGESLPENSGFNASHVPDQISRNLTSGLEWQLARWRFGSRYNVTRQDNRETGRERSDFENSSRGVYVALSLSTFDLTYDLSRDTQESYEFHTRDLTNRHGVTATWRPIGDLALAGNVSRNYGRDDARTKSNSGLDSYAEISRGFHLWSAGGQRPTHRLFVRYSNRKSESRDATFGNAFENKGWTVTTGMNVKVY